MTDIAEGGAGFYLLNAQVEAGQCDIADAFAFDGRFAYVIHATAIAVISVFDDSNINVDDDFLLQYPIARYAVADHMVE